MPSLPHPTHEKSEISLFSRGEMREAKIPSQVKQSRKQRDDIDTIFAIITQEPRKRREKKQQQFPLHFSSLSMLAELSLFRQDS